jgi:hypothetical protein
MLKKTEVKEGGKYHEHLEERLENQIEIFVKSNSSIINS